MKEKPYGCLTRWRLNRIDVKLAGLRAQLEATQKLINISSSKIPGILAMDLQVLPMQIAELEERRKQITE